MVRGTRTKARVVAGSDLYVTGYETNSTNVSVAKVWKNGIATNLSNGVISAYALSIFVSGIDVYVCGNEGGIAKVWKNGLPINLTNGSTPASATSIFVK